MHFNLFDLFDSLSHPDAGDYPLGAEDVHTSAIDHHTQEAVSFDVHHPEVEIR